MKHHTQAIVDLSARVKENGEVQVPVEARRVPLKRAMEEILTLFKKRKRLFYGDIAEALRLDFAMVISACDELQRKRLIEGEGDGKTRTKKPRD